MKTLRKILLSTVLTVFAFVPANAGEMTLSGSMEISATTGYLVALSTELINWLRF